MRTTLSDRVAAVLGGRVYYGWVVVGVVTVANLSAFSLNPIFGLFVTPLEQEFGWDRATIARSLTIGTVAGAVLAPLLGYLIDRMGTRLLMIAFGLASAVAFLLLGQVQAVWHFNLLIAVLLALLITGVGQMMGAINISRWFVRRRGRAMGVAMMGASAGSVLFVPLCTLLIAALGWRQTYMLLGLGTVLLISLPALLFMVDTPERLALGGHRELRSSAGPMPGLESGAAWTLREVARTRTFWLTLLGIMLGTLCVQGYFIHAVPHMEARGFSRALASGVWSTFFFTGIFAKFLWGFVIERIGVRRGLVILFCGEAAGIYLLLSATTPLALFVYAVFNGLAHGPYLQLLGMVWADYFGRGAIGRIYGVAQPAILIAGSLGPWLAGYLFDRTGSYDGFFRFAIVVCLVCVGLFLLAPPAGGRPPRRTVQRAQGGP